MSIYLEFPSISDYPVYNPIEKLLYSLEGLAGRILDDQTDRETMEIKTEEINVEIAKVRP